MKLNGLIFLVFTAIGIGVRMARQQEPFCDPMTRLEICVYLVKETLTLEGKSMIVYECSETVTEEDTFLVANISWTYMNIFQMVHAAQLWNCTDWHQNKFLQAVMVSELHLD